MHYFRHKLNFSVLNKKMWFEFWNDWNLKVRNDILWRNLFFSQRSLQTLHLDSCWSCVRVPTVLVFFLTFFWPPYQVSTQCLSRSRWLTRGGRRRRCVHFCAMHSQCLPKTVNRCSGDKLATTNACIATSSHFTSFLGTLCFWRSQNARWEDASP